MEIQNALKNVKGEQGKYSFSRVFPFLVFTINFLFFVIVVVAMAFDKTYWDKWSGALMFSVLTLGPSLIPFIIQTYVEHKNLEPLD